MLIVVLLNVVLCAAVLFGILALMAWGIVTDRTRAEALSVASERRVRARVRERRHAEHAPRPQPSRLRFNS